MDKKDMQKMRKSRDKHSEKHRRRRVAAEAKHKQMMDWVNADRKELEALGIEVGK